MLVFFISVFVFAVVTECRELPDRLSEFNTADFAAFLEKLSERFLTKEYDSNEDSDTAASEQNLGRFDA